MSGAQGKRAGPGCGFRRSPGDCGPGPQPLVRIGAGVGWCGRCHLRPRRGRREAGVGARGPAPAPHPPPHPAGRCDITPRKAPRTRGGRCLWTAGAGESDPGAPCKALALVAVWSPGRRQVVHTERQVLPVRACHCFPVSLWAVWVDWESWTDGLLLRAVRDPVVGVCGTGVGQAEGKRWVDGRLASISAVFRHLPRGW